MNRLAKNLFKYFLEERPTFFRIPYNEQYECKDFYLRNISVRTIPIKNNNNNNIVIRKNNDKIIPYKDQFECRDF